MKTIYKYALRVTDEQRVDLPRGAVVRLVAVQGHALCLWAEVDPEAPLSSRTFRIYGTGHPILTTDDEILFYVGSVVMDPFVWHVYEVLA